LKKGGQSFKTWFSFSKPKIPAQSKGKEKASFSTSSGDSITKYCYYDADEAAGTCTADKKPETSSNTGSEASKD
jgi:hypothetical protein